MKSDACVMLVFLKKIPHLSPDINVWVCPVVHRCYFFPFTFWSGISNAERFYWCKECKAVSQLYLLAQGSRSAQRCAALAPGVAELTLAREQD